MQVVEMLRISQVCKRLNKSYPTIIRMIISGKLQAAKIGGEWRFEPKHIEDYIKARTTPKTPTHA